MAFENGYNMFNYCFDIFEKYKEDKMLFFKGLQVFSVFESRNDYPYCTDELSTVCERIFGCNLNTLSDVLWKYTVALSDKMTWDARDVLDEDKYPDGNMISTLTKEDGDKLVEDFKNDMEVFFITMTPLFEKLFIGESVLSSKIDKIAVKKTYGEEKDVRIIRKDGKTFDFTVTKSDAEKIVNVFSHI